MGLYDHTGFHNWRWVDNSDVSVDDSRWCQAITNEPDHIEEANTGGQAEWCGVFNSDGDCLGKWRDILCSKERFYVCEYS
mgnify:FL=1